MVPVRTLPFLARQPVSKLHSLTPAKAEALAELGVHSVLDLLTYYPYRYHDRRRQARLADLRPGDEAWVEVEVRRARQVPAPRGRRGRGRAELLVVDASGSITVTFFNQPWRVKQLPVGSRPLLFGRLTTFNGRRQLVNPTVDQAGDPDRRVVALYRSSDKAGITSSDFDRWIAEALQRTGAVADPLPERWRRQLGLLTRGAALWAVHRPDDPSQQEPARRRLAFDELLRLQLELGMRRRATARDARGIRHRVDPDPGADLVGRFVDQLPFALTEAQRRAIDAIRGDLAAPLPMHRLLQGDVGSGKTVVALAALLTAVQGGYQGALMAPTEVLAEQHLLSMRSLLGDLQVPDPSTLEGSRPLVVRLLTSRIPAAERRATVAGLAATGGTPGRVDLVVGTQALLTDDVRFARLGLAVVDEQHRFGVEQRAALRDKGRAGGGADPDLLVMTATPIPRTAAMAVFGDLDLTELDQLPAGRAPITTVWARSDADEAAAWDRVRHEVEAGHRAYVVCPLVEGSERVEARSATEELARLQRDVLPALRLGLLHGQMRGPDKEVVMDDFRSGRVQVLVATTVVEVGVDVPEATVMVIEDADRFGIAQLHQLRGRVGRSHLPSWCYLLAELAGLDESPGSEAPGPDAGPGDRPRQAAASADARRRLQALEESADGFYLAEVDLEVRGEGSILGARQKGRSDLKLASLRRGDRPLVEAARQVADDLLDRHPDLAGDEVLAEEIRLFVGEEEAAYLLKS